MEYEKCATLIKDSDVLLITSGAGMGVDSGLTTYRGKHSFLGSHPFYKKLGMHLMHLSKPDRFRIDAEFAWGFCGYRLQSYRDAQPNKGFFLLQKWIKELQLEHFVVTSNVDDHFQRAGFEEDKIFEVHGNLHYLQCLEGCCDQIWRNEENFPIDMETMKTTNIPKCINCSRVARPNTYMFYDDFWVDHRTKAQEQRYRSFIEQYKNAKIAVIEIGAGTEIPTIRRLGEELAETHNATIIRINPEETEVEPPGILIATNGLQALTEIENILH